MASIPPLTPGSAGGSPYGRADGAAVPLPAAQAADAAPNTQVAIDPLIAALDEAVKAASLRQNGLAPLFADLEVLAKQPGVPDQVQTAARALLAIRLDGNAVDAKGLKAALAQSGLFLEAQLAAQGSAGPDLKVALLGLQQALRNWLGVGADNHGAHNDAALAQLPPPPPHHSSVPAGQAAAPVSIAGVPVPEAGHRVLAETDAALARHTLLQVASLPDGSAPHQRADGVQRLVFDVPLITPNGTAVVQIQIEHDDHTKATAEQEKVWRINFAVNVEPAGPVHARIAQIGERTHVALVAERPDSARALRDGLPTLQAMLSDAALEPGDLQCNSGAPARPAKPAASPGLFLDRAT